MEEKKLKLCPFCGGEAELKQIKRDTLEIKCRSCLIKKTQSVVFKSLEWLEEELIKDWNTRVLDITK